MSTAPTRVAITSSGNYSPLPWRLRLLTQTNSTC